MQLNYLTMLALIFLAATGCSQKNTNTPGVVPVPAPVQTAPEPKAETICASRFRPSMNLTEIAVAAANMRQSCGYSEEQVYALAQKNLKN